MSILTQSRLRALRNNKIIAPDASDSIGEVWVPNRQSTTVGGVGTDGGGMPTGTATPATPSADLVHLFTDYCRVRALDKGQEAGFAGGSATKSKWKISFRYYNSTSGQQNVVPEDAIIRIQKPLRKNSTAYVVGTAMQPAAGNIYFYVCAQAGTTAASAPTFPTPVKGFDAGNWKANTRFRTGDTIRSSGLRYRATIGGVTGSSAPTFPVTALGTVTDGGVTWQLTESVTDGTVVWQLAGRLDEYHAVQDLSDKTYAVLDGVICDKVVFQ